MDEIFERFKENTQAEAASLARESAVLRIRPVPPFPAAAYVCEFDVRYLGRMPDGTVRVQDGPVLVAIRFPADYLRSADPHLQFRVAAMLSNDFVHPNVLPPAICLGSAFAPGTRIGLLVQELYEIVTYRNFSLVERNSLNPEASRLLRAHSSLLAGLKPPPLVGRRRAVPIVVRPL
jgi:hypothetical protein